MKKVLVPLAVILIIMVVALVPIIQNIRLSNSLLKNGYVSSDVLLSSSYSKSDGEEFLFSYYIDYSLLGSGVLSYTRNSDEMELDYDGKTIKFHRSACEMVKENDEFIMADDSSANCKRMKPSDEFMNKVVGEYNVINNIE